MSLLVRNPNIFYGMGRRRRRRRGGSFLSSVGNAISRGAKFVKDNGLLSKVVGLIPHPLGQIGSIGLKAFGLGRRRRRHVVRRRRVGRPRMVGRPRRRYTRRGGALSTLRRLHKLVRDRRLISSALNHLGHRRLASAAHSYGYGRRRTVRRRTVHRRRVVHRRRRGGLDLNMLHRHVLHHHMGGANFFSTEQLAAPKF